MKACLFPFYQRAWRFTKCITLHPFNISACLAVESLLPSRCAGTPLSSDGSATPASVGIKLAERLQEVASQLQQPAAESAQAAAFAATPGFPASSLMLSTPGAAAGAKGGAGGSFDFAADVAAMLQVKRAVKRAV